jgi:hypothetical protein
MVDKHSVDHTVHVACAQSDTSRESGQSMIPYIGDVGSLESLLSQTIIVQTSLLSYQPHYIIHH